MTTRGQVAERRIHRHCLAQRNGHAHGPGNRLAFLLMPPQERRQTQHCAYAAATRERDGSPRSRSDVTGLASEAAGSTPPHHVDTYQQIGMLERTREPSGSRRQREATFRCPSQNGDADVPSLSRSTRLRSGAYSPEQHEYGAGAGRDACGQFFHHRCVRRGMVVG